MTDREWLDTLFQMFSKTTGAENRYWKPLDDGTIVAVGEDDTELVVASGLSAEDADWLTAVHGCLPDLVRRMHQALDEADRLDVRKDELECEMAEMLSREAS